MSKLLEELSISNEQKEKVCQFVAKSVGYINGRIEEAKETDDASFVRVSLEEIYSAVYDSSNTPAEYTGKTWETLYKTEVERVILGCKPVEQSLLALSLNEMCRALQSKGMFLCMYGGVALDWVNRHDNGYIKVRWK